MKIIKKLKDFYWYLDGKLPFHIHYLIRFKQEKGHWPHLFSPRDYSDFIFRDNFYGRHNVHAYLADKLEVRKYVEERRLGDILTKLYGAWDDADKIDFDTLPDQFAIKCNHSCGMNIIVQDKGKLDIMEAKKILNKWLKTKHPVFFERHYFQIKPMIICEELIPNEADGFFPMDYKIHCAHGKPVFIQCCLERTNSDVGKRLVYSPEWKKLPYVAHDYHYTDDELPRPKHLEKMLEAAHILSSGLDYARVDFYDTEKRGVIFGEVTLTPMGGWLSFFTQEALDLMGNEIKKGHGC